jgi:hypothetical protein
VTIGSLPAINGTQGTNAVRFDGAVDGRALKPGRYDAEIVASTSAGSSQTATIPFTIVAR